MSDAEWIKREKDRLSSGHYELVPWHNTRWWQAGQRKLNHFPHISRDNDSQIAFTPDAAYGSRDRKVRIKPAKYLTRFYGDRFEGTTTKRHDLDELIRSWKSATAQYTNFHIAQTAEEAALVYMRGPGSCMDRNHFSEIRNHPGQVYNLERGDLSVAYIGQVDVKTRTGQVTSRCVVWPDKLLRTSRIYGEAGEISQILKDLGYISAKQSGFNGARLPLIRNTEDTDLILFPFADFGRRANIDEKTGLITIHESRGKLPTGHTRGHLGFGFCKDCTEPIWEKVKLRIMDAKTICIKCYEQHYFPCASCGEHRNIEHQVKVVNGESDICRDCLVNSRKFYVCCDCQGVFAFRTRRQAINDEPACAPCHTHHRKYVKVLETPLIGESHVCVAAIAVAQGARHGFKPPITPGLLYGIPQDDGYLYREAANGGCTCEMCEEWVKQRIQDPAIMWGFPCMTGEYAHG